MKIIEINKINKKFGKTGVLYDLSVSFECGLCYMIIGANADNIKVNSVDDMENSEEQQEYDDVEESIDDDDE